MYEPISLEAKFALFFERFQAKVIARMNDYEFKLAKVEGDFVWHSHPETDETFLVVDGELEIAFRDGSVTLHAGERTAPNGVRI